MRQVLAVQQHDPRALARRPKLAAFVEHRLEVAVGVARAEEHKLSPEVPAGVDQRPPDQVQALLRDQARHADDERGRRVDVEAQASLHKLLVGPLALPEAARVVVGGQARVRGGVPEVLVDAVEHPGELGRDVRPRHGSCGVFLFFLVGEKDRERERVSFFFSRTLSLVQAALAPQLKNTISYLGATRRRRR